MHVNGETGYQCPLPYVVLALGELVVMRRVLMLLTGLHLSEK